MSLIQCQAHLEEQLSVSLGFIGKSTTDEKTGNLERISIIEY